MFDIDINGNITCTQGDSGELVINGLPIDKNYQIYLAIQDEKRNHIGGELVVNTNFKSTVTFILDSNFTDLLVVPKNNEMTIYYYGVKLCDKESGMEDTLIIGNNNFGDKATITVYPKQVNGLGG